MKCLLNSLHFEFFSLLIKGPRVLSFSFCRLSTTYLSNLKGETECFFSPQGGHILEVNDCYVIADTIRFFSENNGAFCLSLRHTEPFLLTQVPPPLSAKTNILGMSVTGTVSNHVASSITYSFKNCPAIIAAQ